jgi:hypothetical protein
MVIDIYGRANRAIVDTINATWQRLPLDVQRRLDHVRFTHNAHPEQKAWASAGRWDVDVRDLPLVSTDAGIGIIAHELAHVALGHYDALRSGAKSVAQIEQEADDVLQHQWGMATELAARRLFTGR